MVAVHSGVQTFGVPLQLVEPAASNASRRPSLEPTKTTPPDTAGDDETVPGPPLEPAAWMVAFHSGGQLTGVPAQELDASASKATRVPASEVT